jgi:D-alanyl-D-alanine carboxypeptidase (penicillin-binding protein 5/6)
MVKSIAVSSANDCACAMAEHLAGSDDAFVEKMNQRAMELGMADTHFVNCTGLDDGPNASEHLTSAWDIAIMSQELLSNHPDIKKYTTIWMDTIRDGTFGLSNTNKLVRFYSGCTGLKTGYTSQAGFCLSASAIREDMELIAVVLGCSTSQERFSACKSMLDYGFANFALIQPDVDTYPEVHITLGEKKQVKVTTADRCSLLIDKGQKNEVRCTLEVMEKVTAPVSKGQRLGTMTVRCGEQILAQLPLVAEETVPRLSFGQIWKNLLRTLFLG